MGNKQQKNNFPQLYNKDFVNSSSNHKKGKDREIKQNVSPITYKIPNFSRNDLHHYIKVLSWNVNMDAHSAYAPQSWLNNPQKWECIYEQVSKQNADIISFQELPKPYYNGRRGSLYTQTVSENIPKLLQYFLETNTNGNESHWYLSNCYSSHCGYTVILVNQKSMAQMGFHSIEEIIMDDLRYPAIIISDKNSENIMKEGCIIFGGHLHPFSGEYNAEKRRTAFDFMYDLSKVHGLQRNFIFMGDTNMRENEEIDILNSYHCNNKTKEETKIVFQFPNEEENKNEIDDGFDGCMQLRSCWSMVPADILENSMYTCYKNYFCVGDVGCSRYDKIFAGSNLKFVELSVFDCAVSEDKYHFLSDHRGIYALLKTNVETVIN